MSFFQFCLFFIFSPVWIWNCIIYVQQAPNSNFMTLSVPASMNVNVNVYVYVYVYVCVCAGFVCAGATASKVDVAAQTKREY